ncbi:DNA-deoxyinosine glycosylase [Sphingomonas parva]|uniref:DNA-deoxyinosine glycosylase n=1 Tax=Sphingomonas parva TaxID=2555898 RepID=A0A4Y8ZQ65_9SPHN|nr:DNA-deoxyinosine glycosylase [Sphingomonas parva]TFI58143.1 DNA-deoxyinosine glycosylase [Sphingomonas parva]
MDRKSSFAPVADARCRILVLGSLPGEESLARRRYYANPRNQFWRLIGGVIEQDIEALDYGRRLEALLRAGIGLWDTVGSATRRGSLDGAIRDISVNPLAPFVATLAELRAVAFNGGRSAALGMKQLAGAGPALVALPSSSPAYTLPFDAKLEQWLALRVYL